MYEYVLRRSCECGDEWSTPLRITVQDGEVRSVVDAGTGDPVPVDAEQVESIEDLFVRLEDALHTAYRVTAEYDQTFGYPTAIFIDYQREVIDEELGLSVRDLRGVE